MSRDRKFLLAGNWKMNKLQKDLGDFFTGLKKEVKFEIATNNKVDVLFALPYTFLEKACSLTRGTGITIASENVAYAASGAYTGEVSISMLQEVGVNASLIGHSERRTLFGDSEESVQKRIEACLKEADFCPIVCVGETLEQRESGKTTEVITKQVKNILDVYKADKKLIIAYEPVWAIGTGKTATNEQAEEVHALIRKLIRDSFGDAVANRTRILYGGSANPKNISGLLDQPDIDGALVGGASLVAADFAYMINCAYEK